MINLRPNFSQVAASFFSGCKLVTDNCIVRGLKKFFGWDVQYVQREKSENTLRQDSVCSIYRDLPWMQKIAQDAERKNFFQKYEKISADRGMPLTPKDYIHIEEAYLASKSPPQKDFLPLPEPKTGNFEGSDGYTYSS